MLTDNPMMISFIKVKFGLRVYSDFCINNNFDNPDQSLLFLINDYLDDHTGNEEWLRVVRRIKNSDITPLGDKYFRVMV